MVRCARPAVSEGSGVVGTEVGELDVGGRGEGGTVALSSGSMTSATGLLAACLVWPRGR